MRMSLIFMARILVTSRFPDVTAAAPAASAAILSRTAAAKSVSGMNSAARSADRARVPSTVRAATLRRLASLTGGSGKARLDQVQASRSVSITVTRNGNSKAPLIGGKGTVECDCLYVHVCVSNARCAPPHTHTPEDDEGDEVILPGGVEGAHEGPAHAQQHTQPLVGQNRRERALGVPEGEGGRGHVCVSVLVCMSICVGVRLDLRRLKICDSGTRAMQP